MNMKNIVYALFALALLSALGVQNSKAVECDTIDTVTFFCVNSNGLPDLINGLVPFPIKTNQYQNQFLQNVDCNAPDFPYIKCKTMGKDNDKIQKIKSWANSAETKERINKICQERGGLKYGGKWTAHPRANHPYFGVGCSFTN